MKYGGKIVKNFFLNFNLKLKVWFITHTNIWTFSIKLSIIKLIY